MEILYLQISTFLGGLDRGYNFTIFGLNIKKIFILPSKYFFILNIEITEFKINLSTYLTNNTVFIYYDFFVQRFNSKFYYR